MIRDLSLEHCPVGKLVFSEADSSRLRVSEQQVAFFHEHGYLSGIRVLTDDQVEELREEL